MKAKVAKIIGGIALSAIICFSVLPGNNCNALTQQELLAQIHSIQQQILLLKIELVKVQIADLQAQLDEINRREANAFIDVIYPNGGEKLQNRKSYYVRWESQGIDRVSIALESPENSTIIASNIDADEGRYYWYAEDFAGSDYRIKIFGYDRPEVSGCSADDFLLFDNSGGERCSDGTLMGKCSDDKPLLCFDAELDLVPACHSCGCPSGYYCGDDSQCH